MDTGDECPENVRIQDTVVPRGLSYSGLHGLAGTTDERQSDQHSWEPELQEGTHGHCHPAHPWKTKPPFSEENLRSYSISVCIHDQQAGAVPGHSLRLATIPPTPTPPPHQSSLSSRLSLPPAARYLATHTVSPSGGCPRRGWMIMLPGHRPIRLHNTPAFS